MKNIARLFVALLAAATMLLGLSGGAFAQSGNSLTFDHTTTGYFLDNTHKLVGCESCHTGGAFRGTPRACATCHAGPGARAPGKPATHIPTTAACDSCHRAGATSWAEKPTGFITGASGHAINPLQGVTNSNCQTCHNGAFLGANALTKPPAHLQTNAACSACHGTTSWLPATNPHLGVQPGTCATCHDGVKAPGKKADHIPTANACDSCHKNFISFVPAVMNHTGVAGQCSTCHSGRYVLQNARGMTSNHIPTNGLQCDNCHQSTASWVITFNHNDPNMLTPGTPCATCHGKAATTSAMHQSSGHIPTAAVACNTCHNNYVSFKPAQMDHTGLTACSSCHNGAYTAANAQAKSGRHITTTLECSSCHAASVAGGFVSWSPATMNHTGLNGQCKSCHSGGYVTQNAQTMTATHIATNNAQCDTCHSSTTTWATGTFNHASANPPATGRCSSCHNGRSALGLSINHIPTTAQCDSCHTTFTAFSSVTMNHAGTAGACKSCHNGNYLFANALFTTGAHIPTAAQCDTCHTNGFQNWNPVAMNHTGLNGQCSTCHGGGYVSQKALEKPLTHVATTAQCDTCHGSTTSWATAKYTHDQAAVAGRCDTCHASGKGALSAIPGVHIPTTAQCDTCHKNFVAFKPVSFAEMSHSSVSAVACSTCHGGGFVSQNALAKPSTHIQTTAACDSCHGTGNGYTTWATGSFNHATATPPVARNCKNCHNGVTALSKSASHIPVPATSSCEDCHGTTYTSFKGAKMNHALTTEACTNCHNGSYTQQGAQDARGGYHIPVSTACTTCHGTGNSYTSWSPLAAMDHTGLTGCSTCHDGTYVRQNAQAKPSTHQITNAQCTACHTAPTGTAQGSWRVGAVQDHSQVTNPVTKLLGVVIGDHSCNSCHNGTPNKGLSKPGTHIPTSGYCDTCHTNFTAFAPANTSTIHTGITSGCVSCHGGGYISMKAQAMPQGTHIPTTAPCENCHVVASSFKPASMNHAATSGQCSNCHGGAFASSLNALAKPSTHVTTAAQCDTCHTSGVYTATGWQNAKYPHVGAAGLCSNCHGSNGVVIVLGAQAKSAGHVATTAQCDTCHKTTGYSVWAGTAVYAHAASAVGTCSTCHNGTTAKGKTTGTHITTNAQCDTCHKNYTGFVPASMSHAGTAGLCKDCHNGSANTLAVNALYKAPGAGGTHNLANQSCDQCHGTVAWLPATGYHNNVVPGSCVNCHNGTKATGKSSAHVPTTLACDTCHSKDDAHFIPAHMTHTATMAGQCSGCHGGGYTNINALAQPLTHVKTTAQCDTCHTSHVYTSTGWQGAKYPHVGAAGLCSNCHGSNGVVSVLGAQPKLANHIATNAQCDTCHKTTGYVTWVGTGVYTHAASAVGTCSSCHNGTTAKGKPAGTAHIPTSAQCDTCHKTYTGFNPWAMNHTGTTGQCLTCHNTTYAPIGAVAKPASHATWNDSCDVCHKTTAWLPTSFTHTTAQMGTKTCVQCHNGTVASGKPSVHIPTNEACSVCHRTGIAWLPLVTPYAHTTTVAGSCTNCHLQSFPQMDYKPASNHVPTTASCDACHLKTSWTTLGTINHAGFVACDTCHTGTYTGVVGKNHISNHIPTNLAGMPIPTGLCSNCHTSTAINGFTIEKMNHGSMTTGCKTCHNRPALYAINGAQTVTIGNHEGSKAGNDCSQSGCHKPLGNKGSAYTKWN